MTRVKICGMTRSRTPSRAVELGAWALGMIFWPGSPRACPLEQRRGDRRRSCTGALELVGVFVNATLDEVADHGRRAAA